MGLMAGGDANSLSVRHGIEYLLDAQRPTAAGTRNSPPAPASPGSFI